MPRKTSSASTPPAAKDVFQLVVENTPYAVALFDSSLDLVFANASFTRFVAENFGAEPVAGQPFLELLPEALRLRWQLRLQEALGGVFQRIEEPIDTGGTTRWFDLAFHVIRQDKAGRRIVICCDDITERKRREIEWSRREAALKENLVTRETLLSVISHDLRSPIFQLNGLLFLIKQASEVRDEARLQLQAEDLEERIAHLTHTLDNLLSWSNLQRQNLEPQVSRFSLKSVFEHAAGLLKPAALRKGVRIHLQRARAVELASDREMVAFMARNLINNAIKFSRQDGRVEVITEELAGHVRFSISDQGVGMEPDQVVHLREGGHYFTEAGTWGERGTGLGLRMCYEFAERLHGTLLVQSAKGKGTVVTVQLPQLPLP